MKPLIRLSLLLLIVTAMCTSCKKAAPKQTKHIPKSAVFVAGINTKSLAGKLEKNQATIESIIKSLSGNDSTATNGKQEFEDLKNSGIDLSENFYMSVVSKGGGMGTTGTSGVVAAIAMLKDATKLQAYIKKKHPLSEIKKEKDFSYATWEGENIVAWDDELIVALKYQQNYSGGMEFDSATGTYNLKRPMNADMDLKTEAASYFSLKEDQSVASVPEFRDLMQEKSDATFWINSSSMTENLPLPLPKLKELFGNSFTAATVDFEDGEIVANTKSYASPELRDIYKKYSGRTVDLSLIENYPSNNVNGFMAFSFDPQVISAIVKYLEVGGMVDGFLTKAMGTNYTLQDALKVIKGDFAFVYSDVKAQGMSTTTADTVGGRSQPRTSMNMGKMILNIPVGDKVQMNRLMDKVVAAGMLVKVGNEYKTSPQFRAMGIQASIDDKNLLVSTDSVTLAQYKTRTGKAVLDKEVMKNFNDKAGIVYINIESILNGIPFNSSDPASSVIMPKAKETFKDMIAYAEPFTGKYIEGKASFRFKNEKANSLTSLLDFVNTAAQTAQANRARSHTQVDSTAVLDVQVDTTKH